MSFPTPSTNNLDRIVISIIGACLGIILLVIFFDILPDSDTPPPFVPIDFSLTGEDSFNHDAWQDILDEYIVVTDIARIDYTRLRDHHRDLNDYLTTLDDADLSILSREEQLAFLINAYNAYTLDLVVDHYPTKSIRDIGGGISGPWDMPQAKIAGNIYSLNQLEHELLRREFKDPRIHFSVNCASYGCPDIGGTAFTSMNVEDLLNDGARRFLSHPRGFMYNRADNTIRLSSIFKWFADDFSSQATFENQPGVTDLFSDEEKEQEVLTFISIHLDGGAFLDTFTGDITYDYDWSLNDTATSSIIPSPK